MSKVSRIIIVALLVCAVGVVLVAKRRISESETALEAVAPQRPVAATHEAATIAREDPKREALPRLLDLGADKCIPCKMMAPILAELKTEYTGTFDVHFIDVWEDPEAGKPYGIRMIPTQIFFDTEGRELFRHEGFFSKEDMLAKWKEFGVDLSGVEAKTGADTEGM